MHRVVRGGAFNNDSRNVRAAYRNRNEPDNRNNDIGFRVVVSTFFSCRNCPPEPRWLLRDEAKNGGACSWPRRLISAAPFRDRVVHHALCQVIEPMFERSFMADSFANRVGKGTHRALDRAQQLARRHRYVLQADVRQFFPSLDHAILRAELALKVFDQDVLRLIDHILASGNGLLGDAYDMVFFPGDDLLAAARPRGLPIGNLTSQFWANVYLNGFDHFVKRELRCEGYVRYVDDLLLFGDDPRQLWAWRAAIATRLAALRLTIHPGAHPRPVNEGFPFLGFLVLPERRRLKRRKGIHFRRRLTRLLRERKSGRRSFAEVSASVRGWINHVRYANSTGLRQAILATAHRAGREGIKS